jgi:hypothetical protein
MEAKRVIDRSRPHSWQRWELLSGAVLILVSSVFGGVLHNDGFGTLWIAPGTVALIPGIAVFIRNVRN